MNKGTPKQRMLAAETLYKKIQKDNAALRQFEEALDGMADRAGDMLTYYQSQWLEDRDALEADQEAQALEAMGEDPIYIEITEQYVVVKRILLKCAEYINR